MRKLIIAAAALAAAAPAVAQPVDQDDWDAPAAEIAIDPADIGRMADAMDRLVGAIMDLPVGGIAAAVDPLGRGGIYPTDTIRDVATRDDPAAEARIRANIHGATRGVQAMSRSFVRMMPVLRQSFEEMSRSMREALDEADIGRDD